MARGAFIRSPKRDAGREREKDPYISRKSPKDCSYCRGCFAIYHNKHWLIDEGFMARFQGKNGPNPFESTLCPACLKIAEHYPMGVIQIKGDYLQSHKAEILNLVKNEEKRARGFNPLERIAGIQDYGDALEVETTNEKLAQRIGKRLKKSHQGVVHYKWSQDNKFIRVEWERSLSKR